MIRKESGLTAEPGKTPAMEAEIATPGTTKTFRSPSHSRKKSHSHYNNHYSQDSVTIDANAHIDFHDYLETVFFNSIQTSFIPKTSHLTTDKVYNGHTTFCTTMHSDTKSGSKGMKVNIGPV